MSDSFVHTIVHALANARLAHVYLALGTARAALPLRSGDDAFDSTHLAPIPLRILAALRPRTPPARAIPVTGAPKNA